MNGSFFFNYCKCDYIALNIHCFREIKVLFWLCEPGKKLNWASSPGYINCLSIVIYYSVNPNFKSTLPLISVVVFILPEVSTQKIRVESF